MKKIQITQDLFVKMIKYFYGDEFEVEMSINVQSEFWVNFDCTFIDISKPAAVKSIQKNGYIAPNPVNEPAGRI